MTPKNNYLLFILLWIAALLIFAYSWVPGGLDVDSCNYAVVAKEIARTNNWLGLYDPVYQGPFYYHFPLCIWITAWFFKFFAVTTFSAKLFSMLSGVALTAVLFYFGRLIKDKWAGFFAGLSFLLTNHIVRLSRQCRMDIPVSLFISLAIFSFILSQRSNRKYYLLFGLFTCLAIFTKDVSGIFPLVIVFLYFAIRLKWNELFHPLFILGLLIALGPVILWVWLDKKLLFNTWLNCNFLHLLKATNFNVPWYYYIWAITTKYFYFLPFAIYGGYLAVKLARKDKNYEFYPLIIWILIFPLAFSFGRQKLHYFILPIYPATSLLAGIACSAIFKESIKVKIAQGLKYIIITASIIMLCFPLHIRSKRFIETVNLAPVMDELLKQIAEYDFIVYRQDKAALLFYSQQLNRAQSIEDKASLEDALAVKTAKPLFCYLSEPDFASLSLTVRQNCRIILRYKDRVIITNKKDMELVTTLPVCCSSKMY